MVGLWLLDDSYGQVRDGTIFGTTSKSILVIKKILEIFMSSRIYFYFIFLFLTFKMVLRVFDYFLGSKVIWKNFTKKKERSYLENL